MWLFLAMLMVVLAHLGTIAAVIIVASLAGGAWLWLTRPEAGRDAQTAENAENAVDTVDSVDAEEVPVLQHRPIQVPRQYGERAPSGTEQHTH